MNLAEQLDRLLVLAKKDPTVKETLLQTRKDPNPMSAFCKCCRNYGIEVYEMELIDAGEEFYAAIKRSTNGGGENSPLLEGQNDFYEMFFSELGQI